MKLSPPPPPQTFQLQRMELSVQHAQRMHGGADIASSWGIEESGQRNHVHQMTRTKRTLLDCGHGLSEGSFPAYSPHPHSPPPTKALFGTISFVQSQDIVKPSRKVVPSKRAAQNRAAQRAFRKRREQYIKDLEIKAKEMGRWKEEMERLRAENHRLKITVSQLEKRMEDLVTTASPALSIPEQMGCNETTLEVQTSLSVVEYNACTRLPVASSLVDIDCRSSTTDIERLRSSPDPQLASPSHEPTSAAPNMSTPSNVWTFDDFQLDFALDSMLRDNLSSYTTYNGNSSIVNSDHNDQVHDNFVDLQTCQRPEMPTQPLTTQVSLRHPTTYSSSSYSSPSFTASSFNVLQSSTNTGNHVLPWFH